MQTSESTSIVHWKLQPDDRVSFELLLSLRVVHEMHENEEIIKIDINSVKESDIDSNIEPFEDTTEKIIMLEVHKGEIILAPGKVKRLRLSLIPDSECSSLILYEHRFAVWPDPYDHAS